MKKHNNYYVGIKKAYVEDGEWMIEGVAGGTLIDEDDEKISVKVLEQFVDFLPLPLKDAHPSMGPVMGKLGDVIDGRVAPIKGIEGEFELFIKARLDKENPASQYLWKQLQAGEKWGFSVDSNEVVTETTYDKMNGKFVTTFVSCIPDNVSVTSEPAYSRSFIQVAEMALKKEKKELKREALTEEEKGVDMDDGKGNNNSSANITNTNMAKPKSEKKLKKSETKPEETPEEVETPEEETPNETPEETPEEVEEEETPEGDEEETPEEKEDEEPEDADEVKKAKKKKKEEEPTMKDMMKAIQGMADLMGTMAVHMEKSNKRSKKTYKLAKSMKKEVESLRRLPVGKKSLSKSVNERAEANVFNTAAKSFVE